MFLANGKKKRETAQWGQEDVILLIQDLLTFGAEWIWILRVVMFGVSWNPYFLISRLPVFQNYQISGLPGPKISKFLDFWISRFLPCPFRFVGALSPTHQSAVPWFVGHN